ncbi:MAG TPA: hypothetical protein VJR94_05265 [Candidatus Nitrosocosmicus sp.]|nr:hypothetical protein [Candidatus Nitrosocosmicus sp.]
MARPGSKGAMKRGCGLEGTTNTFKTQDKDIVRHTIDNRKTRCDTPSP